MKNRFLLCITTILLLQMVIGNVYANDAKRYTGSSCQPLSSDAAYRISEMGAIMNIYHTEIDFICPIVKDVMSGKGNIVSASITVENKSTRGRINCYLQNTSHSGKIIKKSSTKYAVNYGKTIFNFGFFDTQAETTASFICRLPALNIGDARGYPPSYIERSASKIYVYAVEED